MGDVLMAIEVLADADAVARRAAAIIAAEALVPYKILPAAVDAVKTVASSRLKLFSEGGKLAFPG